MKVIYNNIIPFKGFAAMAFCGLIFARKEYGEISAKTINHESIHFEQQKEWGFILFFVLYLAEYAINLCKYFDTGLAYKHISFEEEAYANAGNPNYISGRKHYANYRKK